MRYFAPVAAVALVLALAPFVRELPTSDAAEQVKVYPKTYRVSDLPIWTEDGSSIDVSVLRAYLEATVDPASWGKTSQMSLYPKNLSLVIFTTEENHAAIHDIFKRFRDSEGQYQVGGSKEAAEGND